MKPSKIKQNPHISNESVFSMKEKIVKTQKEKKSILREEYKQAFAKVSDSVMAYNKMRKGTDYVPIHIETFAEFVERKLNSEEE